MVFSSILFLFFFLPFSLLIYYLIPYKFKNYFLLIVSLLFYSFGEPIYILLMIFSSVVDYTNGMLISKTKYRKTFLISSIIINLFLLGFFKYSDFLIININSIFNVNISLLNLPLPIGISFFTFQTMSYSFDVYLRKVEAEKSFLNFMLYVSLFPQLIAGPIVRYSDVALELKKRTIDFSNFKIGLNRFLTGLFKKVLIANNIGLIFNEGINMELSLASAWLLAISFGLQIYFDFSGYSDMAIGMGRMLGFSFPENFNYPYISKSVSEFWKRWHISLSSFFKDYIYIPLGGNKRGTLITIRNIIFVWMITGLWHGAAWNFILWGLYFGIILAFEKYIFNSLLASMNNFLKHCYTLIVVIISWAIFQASSIDQMFKFLFSMFDVTNLINNDFYFLITNYYLFIIIAVIFSIPFKIKINKYLDTLITIILFVVSISFLVSDSYNPFLYFRF